MSFFCKAASGLNADIDRHRKKEIEILERIAELEDKTDEFSVIALRVYRNFLNQLHQSKADVTSKIGKRK